MVRMARAGKKKVSSLQFQVSKYNKANRVLETLNLRHKTFKQFPPSDTMFLTRALMFHHQQSTSEHKD